MNKQMAERINGYGPLLRLATPFMVMILLVLLTYVSNDIRAMKTALTNHLVHDMVEIKERITAIETKLDIENKVKNSGH